MNAAFARRRRSLVEKFGEMELDGLLITQPADWYYLTGFTGESGALVVTRRTVTLITDGRFAGQAKAETSGVNVVLQRPSLFESTGKFLAASSAERVGFDPRESDGGAAGSAAEGRRKGLPVDSGERACCGTADA